MGWPVSEDVGVGVCPRAITISSLFPLAHLRSFIISNGLKMRPKGGGYQRTRRSSWLTNYPLLLVRKRRGNPGSRVGSGLSSGPKGPTFNGRLACPGGSPDIA
jgi:hypothetical protein